MRNSAAVCFPVGRVPSNATDGFFYFSWEIINRNVPLFTTAETSESRTRRTYLNEQFRRYDDNNNPFSYTGSYYTLQRLYTYIYRGVIKFVLNATVNTYTHNPISTKHLRVL